ncbi:MAG: hypothetical protein LBQ43_00360, partial [Holosporales bacterium]|nr:hypothetical protein [Holosporales bacterium]
MISLWESARYLFESVLHVKYDSRLGDSDIALWNVVLFSINSLLKLSEDNFGISGSIVDAEWNIDGMLDDIIQNEAESEDKLSKAVLLLALGAKPSRETVKYLERREGGAINADISKVYHNVLNSGALEYVSKDPAVYLSEESFYWNSPYSDLAALKFETGSGAGDG